jgi:hypothetical protein
VVVTFLPQAWEMVWAGLRCTSSDGENTNGSGGLRQSFLGGWLDVDGSIMVWQWLGFELDSAGENCSG